jgi:hypothetical protein
MEKQIHAAYDANGVFVYQAFKASIADVALSVCKFGKGFNIDRLTWIKPSFGWILYRSHYATKHRQARILKIHLRHEGFKTVLRRSVPTSYDPLLYSTESDWREALSRTEVRRQWDPDRDVHLHRLERRAIQLGLEGHTVVEYVNEWIIGLEDVTSLAKSICQSIKSNLVLPLVPYEGVYPVDDPTLEQHLGLNPA